MVRIAIFLTILLAALAYALRKGGAPERAMALILIAMLAADQILHLFIPPRYASVDAGHLTIDVARPVAALALLRPRAESRKRMCRRSSASDPIDAIR